MISAGSRSSARGSSLARPRSSTWQIKQFAVMFRPAARNITAKEKPTSCQNPEPDERRAITAFAYVLCIKQAWRNKLSGTHANLFDHPERYPPKGRSFVLTFYSSQQGEIAMIRSFFAKEAGQGLVEY